MDAGTVTLPVWLLVTIFGSAVTAVSSLVGFGVTWGKYATVQKQLLAAIKELKEAHEKAATSLDSKADALHRRNDELKEQLTELRALDLHNRIKDLEEKNADLRERAAVAEAIERDRSSRIEIDPPARRPRRPTRTE